VDENIVCAYIHREVNLSRIHHQEEKDMTNLFHIKIQVKKTKIDVMFDSSSLVNSHSIGSSQKDWIICSLSSYPLPIGLGKQGKKISVRLNLS
jgi:hypothetical protein